MHILLVIGWILLITPFSTHASDYLQVEAKVVHASHTGTNRSGQRYRRYILTLRAKHSFEGINNKLFTARYLVKEDSMAREMLDHAIDDHSVLSLALVKKGGVYQVINLAPVPGNFYSSNGHEINNNAVINKSISVIGNKTLYDRKRHVLIKNNNNTSNSVISGNSGVTLGE